MNSGNVSRHTHLKLGMYSQHSAEQLDLTKNALEFVRDRYPQVSQDYQYWRQQLGKYGTLDTPMNRGDRHSKLCGQFCDQIVPLFVDRDLHCENKVEWLDGYLLV
ncbi:MAG: hypothetical protein EON54_21340 [Alcaligenaceae bacterium]|nr:MAG: hypothetical protein EON54_21340 [Alcaligenaceae bacterium]